MLRAAKIIHQMEMAHASQKGAVGLEGEMIDAPMLKQVRRTISLMTIAQSEYTRTTISKRL
jgi:citrate lyase beta subunit